METLGGDGARASSSVGAGQITIDVVQAGGGDSPVVHILTECGCRDEPVRPDEACADITIQVKDMKTRRLVHLPTRADDTIAIRVEYDWGRPAPRPAGIPEPIPTFTSPALRTVDAHWTVKAASAGGGPWDALRDGSFSAPPYPCDGRIEADVPRDEVPTWCDRVARSLRLAAATAHGAPASSPAAAAVAAHRSAPSATAGPGPGERPRCESRGTADVAGLSGAVAVSATADEHGDRATLVVEGPSDPRWCGAVRTALASEGALLPPTR